MKNHLYLSLLLVMSIVAPARDSAPVQAPARANASMIGKEEIGPIQYLLGPGDQISIHVIDLDDVSDKPVRIDATGYIDLPLVGRIGAGGLTVDQLRTVLATRLAKFIQDPQIAINILEYHSQPVSIVGAVSSPGIHQLTSPKRLLDVISLAGGLTKDAGARLLITRQVQWGVLPLPGAHLDSSGGFSTADVSVDSLTKAENPAENIFVRPNDVISVPKADIVYVLGQVKKSGGFAIDSRQSISLLRAVAMAEGLDKDAAPKRARILRATEISGSNVEADATHEVAVNLQEILEGKAPDQQLHPNDILYIPDNLARSATKRAAEAAVQILTGVVIFR